MGSKVFPFRVESFQKGTNNLNRAISLESIAFLHVGNIKQHEAEAIYYISLCGLKCFPVRKWVRTFGTLVTVWVMFVLLMFFQGL